MNNLPTWINPALIQAAIEAQEKKLGNSNGDKASPTVENHMNGTKTGVEKVTGNKEKQEKIRNSPQRAPAKSIKGLLDFLGLKLEDFKGKNIIDLGGGFGGLAKNIVDFAKELTIVDPIFLEKNIDEILENNILSQQGLINYRIELIKKNPNLPKETPNSLESKKVLEEMKWWIDYNPESFPNVHRNPSFAENIVGIENNSQDYIFCNYVLSKNLDIEKAVKEISRILKSGGKLIYSDYEKDEKLLDEFRKYFKIEIIYDEKDGIIVICTK